MLPCVPNMSHHHTSLSLNVTVISLIVYFPYEASHPPNKDWLNDLTKGRIFLSIHSLTSFFPFTLQLMLANQQHTYTHQHWHTHRQCPLPISHNRSMKHNFTFHIWRFRHIYSWFLCREGRTVNPGWQDRQISLSKGILHAFVQHVLWLCTETLVLWKTPSSFIKWWTHASERVSRHYNVSMYVQGQTRVELQFLKTGLVDLCYYQDFNMDWWWQMSHSLSSCLTGIII